MRESEVGHTKAAPGTVHALAAARVLDLTAMWSGPSATSLLSQFGADVVKIESPTRLDGVRGQPRVFRNLNKGKRSVLLDLRQPDDHELFVALSQKADVIAENFSPRVLRAFGLTYEVVSRSNPGLVMLSMPAYGTTGPQSNWIGFGWELEATGGVADLMRDTAGRPTSTGLPLADPAAGVFGALAVLAALLRREKTGQGCHIDLAQRDVVLSLIGDRFVADHLAGSEAPLAWCFHCADGWVAIRVRDAQEWADLATTIAAQELGDDSRGKPKEGATRQARERLASYTRTRTCREVVRSMDDLEVRANVVSDARRTAERLQKEEGDSDGDAPLPDSDRHAVLADWLT